MTQKGLRGVLIATAIVLFVLVGMSLVLNIHHEVVGPYYWYGYDEYGLWNALDTLIGAGSFIYCSLLAVASILFMVGNHKTHMSRAIGILFFVAVFFEFLRALGALHPSYGESLLFNIVIWQTGVLMIGIVWLLMGRYYKQRSMVVLGAIITGLLAVLTLIQLFEIADYTEIMPYFVENLGYIAANILTGIFLLNWAKHTVPQVAPKQAEEESVTEVIA